MVDPLAKNSNLWGDSVRGGAAGGGGAAGLSTDCRRSFEVATTWDEQRPDRTPIEGGREDRREGDRVVERVNLNAKVLGVLVRNQLVRRRAFIGRLGV